MIRKTDRRPPMAAIADDLEAGELQALLQPAQVFDHPNEVVNDPDLSLNEKRAILAAWASDACSVEAAPALRYAFGARKKTVPFDDIMDALRIIDQQHDGWVRRRPPALAWRAWARRDRSRGGNQADGSGHVLN
jgi:hypothetical protein